MPGAGEKEIVILPGARTPFGKFGGSLKDLTATDLGVIAARGALDRSGVTPAEIDHVIFGNAQQTATDAIYLARHIGLKTGVPVSVPALAVNRICGSGFQSIISGAQLLLLGEATFVLAGGTESMSQAPHVIRGARWGFSLGQGQLEDSLWAANRAKQVANRRAEMVTRAGMSYSLADLGETGRAKEELEQSLALARALKAGRFEAFTLCHLGKVAAMEGNRGKGVNYLERALKISRKTGITFSGPWILGALALFTDDPAQRRQALAEGEKLLREGCVSHNYFWFYRYAMEVSLNEGNWDEAERYAAALEEYTRPEPLPWTDFFIARGRALAAHGRGRRDEALTAELEALRDEAARVGFKPEIPALERVLADSQTLGGVANRRFGKKSPAAATVHGVREPGNCEAQGLRPFLASRRAALPPSGEHFQPLLAGLRVLDAALVAGGQIAHAASRGVKEAAALLDFVFELRLGFFQFHRNQSEKKGEGLQCRGGPPALCPVRKTHPWAPLSEMGRTPLRRRNVGSVTGHAGGTPWLAFFIGGRGGNFRGRQDFFPKGTLFA
ncbi:MAG: hypothetical protein IIA14_05570 [SAR324 cluster bacterium]|nr:hypothetical protein [SAR324 cluster bacterium]